MALRPDATREACPRRTIQENSTRQDVALKPPELEEIIQAYNRVDQDPSDVWSWLRQAKPDLLFLMDAAREVNVADDTVKSTSGRLTGSALTTELIAKGYDPSVAERISRRRPGLAQMVAGSGAKGRPVTIYRGVRIDPHSYDPRYSSRRFNGEMYVTCALDKAHWYAYLEKGQNTAVDPARHPRYTTILELQAPAFLIQNTRCAVYDGDRFNLAFDRKQIPDDSVFLRRVAALRNHGGTFERHDAAHDADFLWFSYDEAFKNGKFSKDLPAPGAEA